MKGLRISLAGFGEFFAKDLVPPFVVLGKMALHG